MYIVVSTGIDDSETTLSRPFSPDEVSVPP